MRDSEEWLERYYTEQKRIQVQEQRNEIIEKKIHNDTANAQADRDMRYRLAREQEEEKMKREHLKIDQKNKELKAQVMGEVIKTSIVAQNNLDVLDKKFFQDYILKSQDAELQSKKDYAHFKNGLSNKYADYYYQHHLKVLDNNQESKTQWQDHEQARFLQAREIESQHTIQVNQLTYELKKQGQDHEQARYLQASSFSHELSLKEEERITYAHHAEIDTKSHIARSIRDSAAYSERSFVDTQAHAQRTNIDIMAYEEKAEIDKDKRRNEALCYHYERAVDAKWKVWIMEQELRIFGRKASDEEIREYVKKNRDKWDKEI